MIAVIKDVLRTEDSHFPLRGQGWSTIGKVFMLQGALYMSLCSVFFVSPKVAMSLGLIPEFTTDTEGAHFRFAAICESVIGFIHMNQGFIDNTNFTVVSSVYRLLVKPACLALFVSSGMPVPWAVAIGAANAILALLTIVVHVSSTRPVQPEGRTQRSLIAKCLLLQGTVYLIIASAAVVAPQVWFNLGALPASPEGVERSYIQHWSLDILFFAMVYLVAGMADNKITVYWGGCTVVVRTGIPPTLIWLYLNGLPLGLCLAVGAIDTFGFLSMWVVYRIQIDGTASDGNYCSIE